MAARAVGCLGALVCLVMLLGAPAGVVDQPLAGRRLIVRQDASEERLVLVVRDAVELPLPGASDDPTLVGGQLHVGNPATGEWAHLPLSAAGWFPESPTLYRFTNPASSGSGSEVRTVVLREGRGLRVSAERLGITLDEPAQGALAVVLTTGTRRYCALFGGSVRKDAPGRFAARRAAAPSACPEPHPATVTTATRRPSTTRASTTSSTTTTTTTTTSATATTSTTLEPSSSTSTTTSSTVVEESTTTTSSSTSTTESFTCGGMLGLCSGTCPSGQSCGGFLCACQ